MIIYCDMDGVLVNFEKGAEIAVGHPFDSSILDSVKQQDRQKILQLKDEFWTNLPPMPEMMRLRKVISKYQSHILSAEASWDRDAGVRYSRIGKMMWAKKHLGIPLTRVHIVRRSEKQDYAQSETGPNLLIDDFRNNIEEFRRAGGIAIHHMNVNQTLNELRQLGYH